ncbi:glycophorin-A [Pteronotus mesoamericanus]|uniref:glycophorin-A n=1 Tax=Pteronotus mesoamericanus TaxID=1884717 RepID=UPI0023EDFDD7|nr:glycophorin-A [Pteronotus parnellii mesoamericanus]
MYKTIIIGLLLTGCSFSLDSTSSPPNGQNTIQADLVSTSSPTPKPKLTELSVTRNHLTTGEGQAGARSQISHTFSEPAIIGIIFLVMAGVIVLILLPAYCIGKLRQKKSVSEQPPLSHDTDAPLSSVETGNPEQ